MGNLYFHSYKTTSEHIILKGRHPKLFFHRKALTDIRWTFWYEERQELYFNCTSQ